jgi:pSer/pThr/pTyr-binding forkhead associated (FHA) protein
VRFLRSATSAAGPHARVGDAERSGALAAREQPLLVGRATTADLRFPHLTVSRRHALVSLTEEGAYVTDLGSANGTAVNGQPVVSAPLREGDVVSFGLLAARVVRD